MDVRSSLEWQSYVFGKLQQNVQQVSISYRQVATGTSEANSPQATIYKSHNFILGKEIF
jgi:hypothetical protein